MKNLKIVAVTPQIACIGNCQLVAYPTNDVFKVALTPAKRVHQQLKRLAEFHVQRF